MVGDEPYRWRVQLSEEELVLDLKEQNLVKKMEVAWHGGVGGGA